MHLILHTVDPTMGKDILDIRNVCECNRCLGSRTLHPQVSLINLERPNFDQSFVKFEFYAILLIEECPDNCECCGRSHHDFSYATMVFLTPGEVFRMNATNTLPDKGLLLTFHPDLIFRTTLNNHIDNYTFFFYRKEEALHLSLQEKKIVGQCFDAIKAELHHPIDIHSRILLSRLIELLLDYCTRFYERQFILREDENKESLKKLERMLDNYILSGRLRGGIFPRPRDCAEILCLSTAYFNDLLKFETGKTLNEYVELRRIETAKHMLMSPGNTPTLVARQLGYTSVNHFCSLFKKLTGYAPTEYVRAQN